MQNAFGQYTNALTLIKKVCTNCNSKFGETIDLALARETHEGRLRFKEGVKDPGTFTPKDHVRNQNSYINEGLLKGLEVEFIPFDNILIVLPKKDVALRNKGGTYDFYLIDDLPTKEIAEQNYLLREKEDILIFWRSKEQIIPEKVRGIVNVIEKKWSISHLIYEIYLKNEELSIKTEANYTEKILRAIAKIGLNYLAYFNEPHVVAQSCFDPIRRFILEGDAPGYQLCQLVNKPLLYRQGNKNPFKGHVIVLEKNPTYNLHSVFKSNEYAYRYPY